MARRRCRRPNATARDRVLHDDPARRRTAGCTPCPTAWSTRASSRASRRLLREAAALTTQPTLKAFLDTRAAALLSNDYYASDIAWMELDASIEPTIGPYEIYEDEWFNYKAAFEAFITLRDDAETQKLSAVGRRAAGASRTTCRSTRSIRNPKLGALAPIRVVNTVFSSGDAQPRRADGGLQPAERRARGDGEGRQARDAEEQPGGQVPHGAAADLRRWRSSAADQGKVRFDAFFTHILMHELMHGLGPHNITVGGRATHGAAGAEGDLQRDRGSQGRRLGPLRAAVPAWTSGKLDKALERHDVHDVPGVDVPVDPLRHQRGARPRRGDPAELLPRQRRRDRGTPTAPSP